MSISIAFIVFVLVSLINSYLDIRTMQVSVLINYIGIIICGTLYLISSFQLFFNHCLGSVILFFVFLLVWIITDKGIGFGDIHYSLFCGFIAGFPKTIISGLISSLIGLLLFIILKICFKKNIKKTRIPFIPIMFLGSLCGVCFSDFLMKYI